MSRLLLPVSALLLAACGTSATFDHGVASGDPLTDRVILWTRATPSKEGASKVKVKWQVATDELMSDVVRDGTFETGPERDYTVKIDADGLSAGTTYYYQFKVGGTESAVGRTKTLPEGQVDELKVAFASCSHYSAGYFNVYGRIAARDDLDLVLHLGDYIYEYGPDEFGDLIADRPPVPAKEIVTLDDYRLRHATYKSDPDLQAMHAKHPMVAIWDDHETANDAWTDGAENHGDEEGDWATRRDAGLEAYFEWMPVRDVEDRLENWRTFQVGDLATFTMLDTRLAGRELQLDALAVLTSQSAFLEAFNDDERTLLGTEQEAYVSSTLRSSTTTWNILGQQVLMGQLYPPEVPNPNNNSLINQVNILQRTGEDLAQRGLIPGPGLPFFLDAWDGYPKARIRLFDVFEEVGNVVVLSGDSHNTWAFELVQDDELAQYWQTGEGAVAVEFGTGSVSSEGFESVFTDKAERDGLRQLLLAKDPHLKEADLSQRGYGLLTVTPTQVTNQFMFVPDVSTSNTNEIEGPKFTVQAGSNRLVAE